MTVSVALHLGPHKTASTHLQRSLAEADLQGIRFIGPRQLRKKGQTLPERFGFPLDQGEATPLVDVRASLAGLAEGAPRLLLSDENFAGKLQTGWGRVPMPVYPTAERRLALLVAALQAAGAGPLDLFLAVRHPADFLTSIYSQVLHGGRRVRPDAFVAKNTPDEVDWVAYVQRLRGVAGIGTLTLWRYEDYTALFPVITEAMTGQAGIAPHPEKMQQRLTQGALDALMAAKDAGVRLSAGEAAQAFPSGDGEAGFRLYPPAVQGAADAAYARQWQTICNLDGVTALRPAR